MCAAPGWRPRGGSRSTTPAPATRERTACVPRSATITSPGSPRLNRRAGMNFLELLRAGHGDYVINDAAVAYMRRHNLARSDVAKLANHQTRRLGGEVAWRAHLARLGVGASRAHTEAVKIATEGAMWGSITDHGLLTDAVIVSDGAGQFNVGSRALLGPRRASDPFPDRLHRGTARGARTDQGAGVVVLRRPQDLRPRSNRGRQARAVQALRSDLHGAHRVRDPRPLARPIARQQGRAAGRARASRHPGHTNGSENDIRCQVTRRKISAGTRSDAGRDCRDGFLGLMKTCDKLDVRFWDYLGSRLRWHAPFYPPLPDDNAPIPEARAFAPVTVIRDNAVIWMDRIDPGRHSEYADVERARMLESTPKRQTLRSRLRRVWRSLSLRSWRK